MQSPILKDLEAAEPKNIVATKKLLGRLGEHIHYCKKKQNIRELAATRNILEEFLSANKSKFDIEMQDDLSSSYKIKRFANAILQLIALCKEE